MKTQAKKQNTLKPGIPVINLEPGDEILTADEAAALLKVKRNQIYQLTHAKKIKYYKASHRCIRFLKSDLIKYILQNPSVTLEEINAKCQNIYENLTY